MCALTPTSMPPHKSGTGASIKTATEATQAALCLLSHGADPLITTNEGWTPLHALALYCDTDLRLGQVCELATRLIGSGVDPAARAPLLTPLDTSDPTRLSAPWGHRVSDAMMNPSAHRMILQPSLTPLHWAAQRGAVGVVRALVAAGVDTSTTDAGGVSAIEMARDSKTFVIRTGAADVIIDLLNLNV
jgi:ankyrin repeat protein